MLTRRDFLDEAFGVQAERVAAYWAMLLVLEGLLIFKKQIVHFPETVLRCRGFGGFRRVDGVGMRVGQGKIAKSETQLFAKTLLDFFHDGIGLAAIRALVIAVFQKGNWGANLSLEMVTAFDGNRELRVGDARGFIWPPPRAPGIPTPKGFPPHPGLPQSAKHSSNGFCPSD